MNSLLSLWTADTAGRATLLADGRVPSEVTAVAFAATSDTPRDARLELEADGLSLLPRRVSGPAGPCLWVLNRAELAAAPHWRATLSTDDDTIAALDLYLDVTVPRIGELRVGGKLRDGTMRPALATTAGDLRALTVSAEVTGSPASCSHLTLRVDDPTGRSWVQHVACVADEDPARVSSLVSAAPFLEGDWTLSLLHRERTLLRRVRLRLEPSPLLVRAAAVLELGPAGAVPIGPNIDRARLEQRLVFAYALDGVRPGVRTKVELVLRDAADTIMGSWTRTVDLGDEQALERLWFPLAPRSLAAASGAIQAHLSVDGTEVHTQRLELVASPFRSDGTVISGAAAPPAPGPGFGLAQAFFGLVARRRRRRTAT